MNKIERHITDSNLLRTFVEIAECGNLTLAASRLNRSQSAISVQIRKLETELKTSLFVRYGKGMSLSANGEKLLPVARQVLGELSELRSLFDVPLKGRIRVGIPDDFDEGVLERTLADFTRTNPGVEVFASSGCTATFPEAIRKGDLDIAVYSAPDNTLGTIFLEQKSVWAASEAMHLPSSDPVPLALIAHGCWMGELPKVALEQQGRPYNIAYECTGLMSLKAAIRTGFAIGILFESNVEPGMKVLAAKDGFPVLPASKRSMIVRPEAPEDLVEAMANAIQRSV